MKALEIPEGEIELTFSRSSGPGGQNVNKVNSRATLRWQINQSSAISAAIRQRFTIRYPNLITVAGEVVLHSDKYRDQHRNIADVKAKLLTLLDSVRLPPKKRIATKPSTAARARRIDSKKDHGDRKKLRARIRTF